ncbi:MAG: hypothetical protein ACOX0L_07475 [Natronincolaceae bacterium]
MPHWGRHAGTSSVLCRTKNEGRIRQFAKIEHVSLEVTWMQRYRWA